LALAITDRLSIPHRKRLSHSYVTSDEGVRELRIDYGIKEITFDEQHLFAFAEQLVREPSFTGQDAIAWGPGYDWEEIRPLLEALIDEGVVRRGDQVDDPRGGGLVPSLLPPSQCPVPRCWSLAECESITRDLAGRPIEVGYLETFAAVYRVAHPALDGDGRQVGEGNVFPASLRLDRDTEWRVCQYSGSRYRDDAPMNVTALRAMIKHWKPMMATLLVVRDELARRLDLPRAPWTIGELHTLSCVVLGLPAFQLLQRGGSSPQVPLHPVLSSLFRITDGIRMVTSAMLFSIEHTRRADEPLTAAELYEHVEMNGVFIGRTGVCAGPKPLVDEFLAIAVDGAPAEGLTGLALPAEVQQLLAQLPAAIDYGLLGLQTWGVSLSVWLAMSRAYQALAPLFDAAGGDHLAGLRTRLRVDLDVFERLQINLPYDQDVHLAFYRDAYERSHRALGSPVGPAKLAAALDVGPEQPAHRVAADQLRGLLAPRLSRGAAAGPDVDAVVAVVMRYLQEEQAILAATEAIQDAINTALDRPRPERALSGRDLHVAYLLTPRVQTFPYLWNVLEDELGIRVECTARAIEITGAQAACHPHVA
jgi:hypothetical protein